jgi:hypothetical protein
MMKHLIRPGAITKTLLWKQQRLLTCRHVVSSYHANSYSDEAVVTQKFFSTEVLSAKSNGNVGNQFSLELTPNLHRVPSLPYVGSLISLHSGMPERRPDNEFEWMTEMRKKYGDFYVYGMPGLGNGTHGLVYGT